MTARDIIKCILRERYAKNFVMPNYTPAGWWECDAMEVTKAGYMVEYEVKISVSDFHADALKNRDREFKPGLGLVRCDHKKHDLLAAGDARGPARFYFVAPKGLLTLDIIPAWAGLLEVAQHGRWIVSHEAKKAPQLHRVKIASSVVEHARGVCYWRMHKLIQSRKTVDASPGAE